jgi:membrane protease YdiL (CAAX protease family)
VGPHRPPSGSLWQLFRYLLVFILWNFAAGALLLYADPVIGLPGALVLTAALLWGYVLRAPRGGSVEDRRATLRLRRLQGPALRWTLLAVPVMLLLSWALGDLYTRIVPVPAESLNPFESILTTTEGRVMIAVFAIGVAPFVEEFFFRGLFQHSLERRLGTRRGIVSAAALFALVHLLPWIFPLHFVLGMAFGFAVYATRSIWSGVVLHVANNTAAMAGVALQPDTTGVTGTVWQNGVTSDLWISVCLLLVSVHAAVWIGRQMLSTAPGAPLA